MEVFVVFVVVALAAIVIWQSRIVLRMVRTQGAFRNGVPFMRHEDAGAWNRALAFEAMLLMTSVGCLAYVVVGQLL